MLRSLTLLRRLSLDAALVDEAQGAVPAAKIDVLLEELASSSAKATRRWCSASSPPS